MNIISIGGGTNCNVGGDGDLRNERISFLDAFNRTQHGYEFTYASRSAISSGADSISPEG